MMKVREAHENERERWNGFVADNFPPVGAFFQSWEWGNFQRALGMATARFVIEDDAGGWLGLTLAVYRRLPFGFEYVYLPRGPVLPERIWRDESRLSDAMTALRTELTRRYPKLAFIRMEPAVPAAPPIFTEPPFRVPAYYIQPRFNHTVDLSRPEGDILSNFSAAMRNNVRKAERKGVRVESKTALAPADWKEFARMRADTESRAGKHIFPGERYFRLITELLPSRWYLAFRDHEAVGANLVLFFTDTATYLFGAAYTEHLRVKIAPALHWHAMRDTKTRGFKWYDLGGVDETRWPSLTYFKEQFGGSTIRYMGNAYMVLSPLKFAAYHLFRTLRR